MLGPLWLTLDSSEIGCKQKKTEKRKIFDYLILNSVIWNDEIQCASCEKIFEKQLYDPYRSSQCFVQNPEGQKKQPTTSSRNTAHNSYTWIIREPQSQKLPLDPSETTQRNINKTKTSYLARHNQQFSHSPRIKHQYSLHSRDL